MRHLTEKPFEPVMRFFTPERFVRFNSAADGEADSADEEWERAIEDYREYLATIRDRLPSQVSDLADLDLHDAELLGFNQTTEPVFAGDHRKVPTWLGLGILTLRAGDEIITLFYLLHDDMDRYQAFGSWPFSGERVHWLYEELEVTEQDPRSYVHRILFSDGTALKIRFASIVVNRVPLDAGFGTPLPGKSA